MRPKASRGTSTSAAVARAKMLIKAKLWWCHGFPSGSPSAAGLPWTSVARAGRENESLLLSRRELSAATHALRKLSGEYRHAMPKLVEDPAAFNRCTQALLDALKPAVHRLAPPAAGELLRRLSPRTTRQAARLRSARPQLTPLIDAVLWVCATAPERLGKMLSAVEQSAAELERILRCDVQRPLLAALNLVDLASDLGPGPTAPLLALLADPETFATPTRADDYPERLRRLVLARYDKKAAQKPAAPPERPTPSLGAHLFEWTEWTAAQDRATRRRALKCFSRLGTDSHMRDWTRWWQQVEKPERQLRKPMPPQAVRLDQLDKLQRRMHQLASATPPPVSGKSVSSLLRWYAGTASSEFLEEACASLDALGDSRLAAAFLEHWQELYLACGEKFARRGVSGFRAYLGATTQTGEARLLPWQNMLKQARAGKRLPRFGFEEECLLERPGKRRVDALYSALAVACNKGKASEDVGEALADLATCDLEYSAAAEVAIGLADPKLSDHYFESNILKRALRLVSAEPSAALELLTALATLETSGDQGHAMRLLEDLHGAGMLGVGLSLIADGHVKRLAECGSVTACLRTRATLQTVAPGDRVWTERYPEALRAALLELCACDEHAQRTAHRILKQHFPKPEDVTQQIHVLESKLAGAKVHDENLARRLRNLRARLEEPARVSSLRIEHLGSTLRRAAREAALQRLEAQTSSQVTELFEKLLALSPLPDWATDPRSLRLLLPILELPDAFKQLAIRLLRARAGPPPWDLRDAPENSAFLRRLRSRGVATAPWIDGELRIHVTQDAQNLELALESDPLLVLEMGAHFNTCLSPGSFNYFSTFANAADINKQVLYARDAAGQVVGRCLLALTETGGLLTFHPYAHSGAADFGKLVARFAQELAERMGVTPVARGQVPMLVASDWYDDGPHDLCRRFVFLEPDSAFRKALVTQSVEDFVDVLKTRFAPLELNELTLPLIVELPELAKNPALIRPLLPLLSKLDALPGASAMAAARLTLALGEGNLAKRLFAKRIERYAIWYFRRHHHFETDAAALLVELEPRLTLRLLRMTRPRGVRGWNQEFEYHRFEVAARAYEALHRPNKAIELYRHAEGSSLPEALRIYCAARAEELERQLGRGTPGNVPEG